MSYMKNLYEDIWQCHGDLKMAPKDIADYLNCSLKDVLGALEMGHDDQEPENKFLIDLDAFETAYCAAFGNHSEIRQIIERLHKGNDYTWYVDGTNVADAYICVYEYLKLTKGK